MFGWFCRGYREALASKDEVIAVLREEISRLQHMNTHLVDLIAEPKEPIQLQAMMDVETKLPEPIESAINAIAGPHEADLRKALVEYAQAALIAGQEPGDVAVAITEGTNIDDLVE